ncbi:N-formylglutamate amidohydrolase [Vibrio metschnikovii]|uniref:N-formylglutamate amidohydrolase n=1 Tax=Vibrio metschnikovii TaxID=28172 RepID=UPI001C303850|nr:N-formylglutamate amidohydrolase [Vibrio metschnikovii]EKO3632756.1 N-formylglutamate amidohydrolase [Vibrio metschnikovii]EKO3767532.1 N-formylglutamate amidohydrolase [Vibrio metschnikovii]
MILNIPHSGTNVLNYPISQDDINLGTDWFTNELFQHQNSDCVVQEHSRFIVDCERLPNDTEPLFKDGYGIIPTKDFNGSELTFSIDSDIAMKIYHNHHEQLNKLTRFILCYIPVVFVVDCHSFGEHQIKDKSKNFDFCFGYNADFDNLEMLENMIVLVESNGYTVGINEPFGNAIVPNEYYGNESVKSIMIEVNKSLYLTDNFQRSDKFTETQNIINQLLDIISNEEASYN